jgi:phosphate transport system permease protein
MKDKLLRFVFIFTAFVSTAAVAVICVFLLLGAMPALREVGVFRFLFGGSWRPSAGEYGVLPMLVGSICVTVGAAAIGVPLGILCSVFLQYFCPKKMRPILDALISLMAGIPSVIYGFVGLMVLVPLVQNLSGGSGKGLLTVSLLLGVMLLPTVVGVSSAALAAVPKSCYEGSLALGATHERSVYCAVLPAAKSGVFASVILAVGRAIGETMAVAMVAGNQPVMPSGIFGGVRTLTANIVLEMAYAPEGLHRSALIASAAVLFLLILIINLCFHAVKHGRLAK